jgi:hypothetical protein
MSAIRMEEPAIPGGLKQHGGEALVRSVRVLEKEVRDAVIKEVTPQSPPAISASSAALAVHIRHQTSWRG